MKLRKSGSNYVAVYLDYGFIFSSLSHYDTSLLRQGMNK